MRIGSDLEPDPDPGGQLITDPPDPISQYWDLDNCFCRQIEEYSIFGQIIPIFTSQQTLHTSDSLSVRICGAYRIRRVPRLMRNTFVR